MTTGQRRSRRHAPDDQGQSLVEFAVLVPVFMLVLMGLLEAGMLFAHLLGLQFASREGARVGAGLASGTRNAVTWPQVCGNVDTQVVAAVERTMRDRGSLVDVTGVAQIRISRVRSDGSADPSATNTWTYTGLHSGPEVDGTSLSFSAGAVNWSACNRLNGVSPESLGVWISYNYAPITFVGTILGTVNGAVQVDDHSVFVLNP